MKGLTIFFVLFTFLSWSAVAEDGLISYFEGDVSVKRNGRSFDADFGLPLFKGDILETGFDSLLIVQLTGRGELKLRGNTILVMESTGNDTSVLLNRGSVFSKISRITGGSFSVKTPSMVAGVRGTEFFVAYGRTIEDEPDIWLCVNEGSVAVAVAETGESVLVNEGEGINILSGITLTDPVYYKWTDDLNWNTDPGTGSVIDKTDLDAAYSDLLDQDYE